MGLTHDWQRRGDKDPTGDLTATDKGVVTATLSGTYTGDAVASDAGTLSLRAGAAEGNLTSTGSAAPLRQRFQVLLWEMLRPRIAAI